MVKPFIRGQEFCICLVCDRNHNIIDSVSIKKLICNESGKAWSARQVTIPLLTDFATQMAKELQWVGPIEFEFIRDELREQYALIDINPRFPAWIGYSADIGVNLPRAALLSMLNHKIERAVPSTNDLIYTLAQRDWPVKTIEFGTMLTRKQRRYD